MTTRAVRTALEVTREREYAASLKRAETSLTQLASGVSGAGSMMRGMGPQAAVAVAAIAAVAAAATAATAAIRTITSAVYDLGQRGGSVSPVAQAFERMASPDLLSRLDQLSGHLVDHQSLMTRANQVLQTGIMTQQQWSEAIEVTVRAAQDLGRDVGQSVETLATFASGGGMEGLARLGVNMLEIREQLRQMGLSAESTRGRMIAMDMALQQLDRDLGTVDNSSGNVGDSWQQIRVALQNTYDQIARAFAENQNLIRTFDALAASIRGSGTDGEAWGTAIADAVVVVTQALVAAVPPALSLTRGLVQLTATVLELNDAFTTMASFGLAPAVRYILGIPSPSREAAAALRQIDSALDAVEEVAGATATQFGRLTTALREASAELDRTAATAHEAAAVARSSMAPGMDAARDSIRDARLEAARASQGFLDLGQAAEQSADRAERAAGRLAAAAVEITTALKQSVQRQREEAEEAAAPRRRGGGGGPSRAQLLREAEMAAGQERKEFEVEQAQELSDAIAEGYREQLDALTALMAGLDERSAMDAAEWERWRVYWQERKDLEDEAAEAEAERVAEQIRLEEELQAAQIQRINDVISNTRRLANSMKASFGSIIGAMEATGHSSEETQRAYGILLVAYNSVMAATDLADMARAIAEQDYVGALAYGLAMAGHIAAAVEAGAKLGGGSASVPATGTFTPAQRAEPEDRSDSGRGTIINNNYGFGQGNSAIGEAVTQHAEHYRRMEGSRYEAPRFYG